MRKKTKMRATSLLAFSEILENLGERQMQVLQAFREIQPCSNLMLSKHIGLPINCITPRVKELRDYKIVLMDKVDVCKYTKRKVTYWRIKKWLQEIMIYDKTMPSKIAP